MSDNSTDDEQQWTMNDSMQKLASCLEENDLSVDELFAQIDSDSDGSINGPELYKGLQSLVGEFLSPGQISSIIKAFDSNEDNRIDVEELRAALAGLQDDSAEE
ncbi:MAG: EF-hand domain-containing protein [Candidatus Poseidoniaceae archaeon]|nr:EF-hand domain-containing protein [Candidatus Poseidoniaceae archaeon]